MTCECKPIAGSITINPDGSIDVQSQFARPSDPMCVKQPPEIAAQMLKLPHAEIRAAMDRGLIPSTQDMSGLRVAVLRDVVEGVRRLREEGGR